ncbi:MAG: DsbA family protein, partial [Chloroflexota bacterium]|nr:DsbA family protein [Chloroflexota bacterium]
EILSHWEATRRYGNEPKINVELMRSRPFPYPYSMPALMAVKAAEFQAGQEGHARCFDRAQEAHLVECRNVGDRDVLIDLAREIGLDMELFLAHFESRRARDAVMADRAEALSLGIHGTPTVVFQGRWILSGAVLVEAYRQVIEDLLAGQEPRRVRGLRSF